MALVRDHMALIFLRTLILSGGVALSACGGGGGTAGAALTVEVLSSGTYYGRFHFERLRLTRDGNSPTYAIWFPPPGLQAGAKAPAVLLSDPYGGIDWTGEALDTQAREEAATHGFVMLPDVHGSPHPAGIPLYVPYDYAALADPGGGALAYLLNGIAVLMVYQRIYAGGDLQNDIDDTLSGLLYLRQNPQVDRRLIGAWGSSYGGSLLLYAMAQAADAQRPGFAAILTPIVDFEQFVTYADWLAAVHQDAGQGRYCTCSPSSFACGPRPHDPTTPLASRAMASLRCWPTARPRSCSCTTCWIPLRRCSQRTRCISARRGCIRSSSTRTRA